jgi:hypothetical protein
MKKRVGWWLRCTSWRGFIRVHPGGRRWQHGCRRGVCANHPCHVVGAVSIAAGYSIGSRSTGRSRCFVFSRANGSVTDHGANGRRAVSSAARAGRVQATCDRAWRRLGSASQCTRYDLTRYDGPRSGVESGRRRCGACRSSLTACGFARVRFVDSGVARRNRRSSCNAIGCSSRCGLAVEFAPDDFGATALALTDAAGASQF